MRYLKLLILFARTSLLAELEYRANFAAQLLVSITFVATTLLTTFVLFGHTDNIGGWRYDEALLVSGTFVLMSGIIMTVFQPNVQRTIEMVRDGTLDFTLLKPVNAQFMVSVRHIKTSGFGEIIAGLVVIGVAMVKLRYEPDVVSGFAILAMFTIAVMIVYSIWIAMATMSFWFVKVGNLTELFNALFDTGRLPVTAFKGAIRAGLTFVIPVAFITTFPAQAVLRTLEPGTLLIGSVFAAALIWGSSLFWRTAIRSYASASS